MKNKSLFLALVILCLTSVEIYSSRQELKFDAPLPSNTENGNATQLITDLPVKETVAGISEVPDV